VIRKARERGSHSPRWATEPEKIIIIIIIIIIMDITGSFSCLKAGVGVNVFEINEFFFQRIFAVKKTCWNVTHNGL
jgi:hypothetical protein